MCPRTAIATCEPRIRGWRTCGISSTAIKLFLPYACGLSCAECGSVHPGSAPPLSPRIASGGTFRPAMVPDASLRSQHWRTTGRATFVRYQTMLRLSDGRVSNDDGTLKRGCFFDVLVISRRFALRGTPGRMSGSQGLHSCAFVRRDPQRAADLAPRRLFATR